MGSVCFPSAPSDREKKKHGSLHASIFPKQSKLTGFNGVTIYGRLLSRWVRSTRIPLGLLQQDGQHQSYGQRDASSKLSGEGHLPTDALGVVDGGGEVVGVC